MSAGAIQSVGITPTASTTPIQIATLADAAGDQYQVFILAMQNGSTDPSPINLLNPLPVTGSVQDASVFQRGKGSISPVGGVAEATAPTLISGQSAVASFDLAGNQRVTLVSGGAQAGTAGNPSADVLGIQGVTGMVPITTASTQGNRFRVVSQGTTNATLVKSAPGTIVSWALYNNTTSPRYVKFYDKASAPTVGTDSPAFTIIVPPGPSGMNCSFDSGGIPFTAGVGFGITAAIADNDTTATALNDVTGVLVFK